MGKKKFLSKKIDITKVKVGMIGYEDDSFSFNKLSKKVKGIVELIDFDEGIIYVNMSVSDLCRVKIDQLMSWYEADALMSCYEADIYNEKRPYPCKKNEKFVWYEHELLKQIYNESAAVKKTFNMLNHRYYTGHYWSSTEASDTMGWGVVFGDGYSWYGNKDCKQHVAIGLAIKV